jgi:ferritin
MSSWCESKGLEGAAKFLEAHSIEEREHMMRLFKYINETGSMAIIDAIDRPPHEFSDIHEVFQNTYKHEKMVTKSINDLTDAALKEKDFSTFNFLQWYVAEQHEEEKLFKSILDQIEIIGLEGRGLYFLDKKIGQIQAESAEKEQEI